MSGVVPGVIVDSPSPVKILLTERNFPNSHDITISRNLTASTRDNLIKDNSSNQSPNYLIRGISQIGNKLIEKVGGIFGSAYAVAANPQSVWTRDAGAIPVSGLA